MGHYDLYGRAYPTRREAENAEMAQCAAIDADLASQRVNELEQRVYELSQPTQHDNIINELMIRIIALEKRVSKLDACD